MKRCFVILLCAFFIAGCSGGDTDKKPRKTLTKRERDSVLSKSKLPGARVVGKAISVSDTASARAKRIDGLTK